jgi:hypothetical protein
MAGDVKDSLVVNELWTGTHVASAGPPASGYVIIKDKTGTDRKFLVYT